MAAEWWWFLALNAMVAAIALLSKVQPPLPSSPRPRGGGITRRASSAVLQRLRSSIFSFPSVSFHTAPAPLPLQPQDSEVSFHNASEPLPLQPQAQQTAVTTISHQETEEPSPAKIKPVPSTPRSLLKLTPRHAPSSVKEQDDPNAMSMEEAYALVQAARRQRPREEEEASPSQSDVDAKAEEFIQGFKEDLRQQRLNSIFNYTQMLKRRAFGDGRRQPAAQQPDHHQR